jgi:GNAT superfamily N-acetyltransferase
MRHFVDFWNGNETWSHMPEKQRAAINGRARLVAAHFDAVRGESSRLDDYAVIKVPVLLVHGSDSPAPMAPIVMTLTKVLPQARTLRVPGAGHMLPITHAETVNQAIIAHLSAAGTSTLRLRRLGRSDVRAVNQHLLSLDRMERHARFGVVCNDEMIISYVHRVISSRSIVIGAFDEASGHVVGIAEAHPMKRQPDRMELAVSVNWSHRRRGLGRRLVRDAIAGAFADGAESVAFFFDSRNTAVVGLAKRFRFRIDLTQEYAEIHRGDATAQHQPL